MDNVTQQALRSEAGWRTMAELALNMEKGKAKPKSDLQAVATETDFSAGAVIA